MLARRRTILSAVFVPFIVGLIGFFNLTARPRYALIHSVDVLQLLATGMCFGVALSALFSLIRGRRASKQAETAAPGLR